MPIYEYRCNACNEVFELQRKFSDPPVDECPSCNKGPVEKLVSKNSFALKGSGWYRTDYAGKSAPASTGCAASGSKPSCAGCPGASSD